MRVSIILATAALLTACSHGADQAPPATTQAPAARAETRAAETDARRPLLARDHRRGFRRVRSARVVRRIRRPRAGDDGRAHGHDVSHRPVPAHGPQTRQQGQLSAGRADHRDDRARRCGRRHFRVGRWKCGQVYLSRRRHRAHAAGQIERRSGRQRHRVRGIRRGRAGISVERFRRRRREGQDGDRAGQRSGLGQRRRHAVQGQGDDVLRPLDVQVRRMRAARRGGVPDRARHRRRGLSVAGRRE